MTTKAEPANPLHRHFADEGLELVQRRGATAPRSFGGDPDGEELRALRESAGLVDATGRALVRVEGKRAREMVGGLVTNHVAGLEPDRALYAFLLTPKGRPVAEMRVLVRDETHLLLDMPAACREGALEHLKKYLPPIYAAFELDEGRSRLSLIGPESAAAVAEFASATGVSDFTSPDELEPLEFATADDLLLMRREPIEGPGFDLYVPTHALLETWEALETAVAAVGGRPAGEKAHEIWRVERGIPVYGAEIDTDRLPQETGQEERAVDFESGCYTGQEVVARIHYRGKVNRRMMGLRLPEGDPPAPGRELYADGRVRGTITSSVRSPRFGPIALGYVRREIEAGETLALEEDGEPRVRVTELPFGEEG